MRHTLLLPVIFVMSACGKSEPPPEPIRPVKVWQVGMQSSASGFELPGEVRARRENPLAFRVGGKVVECRADLGATVKRGQVLARLEGEDYRLVSQSGAASVAELKSTAVFADAELARYRTLREKGFVSAAVLDQKKAAADAARAKLEAMQSTNAMQNRQLGYTDLAADSDGVLTAADCNPGQVVAVGQPVFRLAQGAQREIEVHVPESQVTHLKGASYSVGLNATPEKLYRGTLRELAAAADPATRTYAARIVLEAPDAALRLGMSASVQVSGKGDKALRLPLSAVTGRDGQPKVWKLDKSSTVHGVAVTLGEIEGNEVRVAGGLAQGDQIVVAGANLLREGQVVRPLK